MANPIKLTQTQAAAFLYARTLDVSDPATAKTVRKETWAHVRETHAIPETIKLKVELDNKQAPDYLVLKDKANDGVLMGDDCGDYSHTMQAAAPTTTATSTASPVPVANGVRYYRIALSDLEDYLVDTLGDVTDEVTRPEDFQLAVDGDTLLVRAD